MASNRRHGDGADLPPVLRVHFLHGCNVVDVNALLLSCTCLAVLVFAAARGRKDGGDSDLDDRIGVPPTEGGHDTLCDVDASRSAYTFSQVPAGWGACVSVYLAVFTEGARWTCLLFGCLGAVPLRSYGCSLQLADCA